MPVLISKRDPASRLRLPGRPEWSGRAILQKILRLVKFHLSPQGDFKVNELTLMLNRSGGLALLNSIRSMISFDDEADELALARFNA